MEQTEFDDELVAIIKDCFQNALAKGFWSEAPEGVRDAEELPRSVCYEDSEGRLLHKNLGETLLLISCELAEGYEGWRKGVPLDDEKEGLVVELADVVIRVFDLVGALGPELFVKLLRQKMAYNKTRPYKHGKKT